MKYFCPNCGTELEQKYKFCPSCGFNLQNINFQNSDISGQQIEENIIICDSCGEENPADNSVCKGCGIKLSGKEETRKRIIPSASSYTQKPVYNKTKNQKVNKQKQAKQPVNFGNKTDDKNLDINRTLIILGGMLLLALAILFLAGVFDSPVTTNTNVTNDVPQNQNSGVDLARLQEINQLEEQTKNNPADYKAVLQLAHLKNDSGLYEQAIANYKKYLEKIPSDADARIDMGVCYYNLGNYPSAIAEMEKALEFKSDHQIGHLNLGIVNLAAGNEEVSKNWLKKAVALNPLSDEGKRAKELLESH